MIQSASFPDTLASPSKEDRKHHIYEQYFTPAEREMLAAIPENDLTGEIDLLRVMLARSFAQVPSGPDDKKHPPLPLKLMIDYFSTFCRVAIILARLVALHRKLHSSHNALSEAIFEALGELDPDDLEV
jgi:hypothetical protein